MDNMDLKPEKASRSPVLFVAMILLLGYSIASTIDAFCTYLKNVKVKLPYRIVYCWNSIGTIGVILLMGLVILLVLWIVFFKKSKLWLAIVLVILSIAAIVFGIYFRNKKLKLREFYNYVDYEDYDYTAKLYQDFYESGIVVEMDGVRYAWDGSSVKIVEQAPKYFTRFDYSIDGEDLHYERVLFPESYGLDPKGIITEEQLSLHWNYACVYLDKKDGSVYLMLQPYYTVKRMLLKMTPVSGENTEVINYLPIEDAKRWPDDYYPNYTRSISEI